MEKEKASLKDRIQSDISSADAHIDALKKLSDNAKGTAKKRDDEMQKKLSDLRDKLQDDLDKIDKAQSVNDWKAVRPAVSHDLQAMGTSLRIARTVTKVRPRTGTTNKQPSESEPSNKDNAQPSHP
jgi:hypothetical protein